jgi:hypothetical protein
LDYLIKGQGDVGKAPVKTGIGEGMKEPYVKGAADPSWPRVKIAGRSAVGCFHPVKLKYYESTKTGMLQPLILGGIES